MDTNTRNLIATVDTLRKLNPLDPAVVKVSTELAGLLGGAANGVDVNALSAQVKRLHAAAAVPAKNYGRILSIATGLNRAVELSRNSDEATKAKIASLIKKVAGIFAECDTADELSSKSLAEIEAAVHRLYNNGKQNDPHTYDFVDRGAGHHGKK